MRSRHFYCLLLTIALLVLVEATNLTANAEFSVVPRLMGGSTIAATKYPFIVAIRDATNLLGPGVVVAKNWFMCHPDVVGTIAATDLIMYGGLANGNAPTGRKYRGKEIVQYVPARDILKNALTMVRFCPDFQLTKYVFPSTAPTFPYETAVTQVNYGLTLKEANRAMGITCQCVMHTTYDENQHFCLDESASNALDYSTDPTLTNKDRPGTICMLGNDVIGINVGMQNKGGEPYLDISKFTTWIKTTAGI